jgi:hypothetical protein
VWWDKALGNRLKNVHRKNANPAMLQVITAKPSHSIISPKKLGQEM